MFQFEWQHCKRTQYTRLRKPKAHFLRLTSVLLINRPPFSRPGNHPTVTCRPTLPDFVVSPVINEFNKRKYSKYQFFTRCTTTIAVSYNYSHCYTCWLVDWFYTQMQIFLNWRKRKSKQFYSEYSLATWHSVIVQLVCTATAGNRQPAIHAYVLMVTWLTL